MFSLGWFALQPPQRRWIIPEVVQTSAMDCGPAALKAILEGFGISVHYGRLREACQTGVEGTSIDMLEEVACQLGLDAQQVLLPIDHLFLPQSRALPALVVVRLPDGLAHFVVAWRSHGSWVQIMDPATGRRWLPQAQLLNQLYLHQQAIPIADWLAWAQSEAFILPLQARWQALGIHRAQCAPLRWSLEQARQWQEVAALDAATRMADALMRGKGLYNGQEAIKFIQTLADEACHAENPLRIIPASYWLVQTDDEDATLLHMRGAVLLQINGLAHEAAPSESTALRQPTPNSWHLLQTLMGQDGLAIPTIMLLALLLSVTGVTLEALLLKGLLDIGDYLGLLDQRMEAVQALLLFFIVLLLLSLPLGALTNLIGRRLETRLRIALWEKIPKLGSRYFDSRLIADITQRAHELRELRTLPQVVTQFFRYIFTLVLISAGLIWLNPSATLLIIMATSLSIALSLAVQPWLREEDLRQRTQLGVLNRFYLDALQGLIPIRTHSAARALRYEHENLLTDWQRSGLNQARVRWLISAGESLLHTSLAIWIVFHYIAQDGDAEGILVLIYWTLRLPETARALADTAQLYPLLHNRMLRLLEPLNAPEENPGPQMSEPDPFALPASSASPGLTLHIEQANVQVNGQYVLKNLHLTLYPGEHVALVGHSGAGKTTLAGLLLGWYLPTSGSITVNNLPLNDANWQWLRRHIAWVDPTVQLWNRTLEANLCYGNQATHSAEELEKVLTQAELHDLVARLPHGLRSMLGEGGGLVSGGEGQRIRLARALLRQQVRLVILDEPFRGLDRVARTRLLHTARQHWRNATLLLISHDVADTRDFDRVLVMEQGHIVEQGPPMQLATQANSRYLHLLQAEQAIFEHSWNSVAWHRLWLENGRINLCE